MVEVVRGVYEAFGRGDVAGVLGAMTEDMEWCEAEGMPYGGVYHGGEEVGRFHAYGAGRCRQRLARRPIRSISTTTSSPSASSRGGSR